MNNPNLIFKSILSFLNTLKPLIIKGKFESVVWGSGYINVMIAFMVKHRSPDKVERRRMGDKTILSQKILIARRGEAAPNKFFVGVLDLELVRAFGGGKATSHCRHSIIFLAKIRKIERKGCPRLRRN